MKHISHSADSGTGSGGSIYYAIVGGSGNDSRGLGGGDFRFHMGSVSQSTVRSDLSLASLNNTSMWSPSQMGHRSYAVGGSDLSSASLSNTSMWSPSQMGHRSYAVGGDYTDSGRRGHYVMQGWDRDG